MSLNLLHIELITSGGKWSNLPITVLLVWSADLLSPRGSYDDSSTTSPSVKHFPTINVGHLVHTTEILLYWSSVLVLLQDLNGAMINPDSDHMTWQLALRTDNRSLMMVKHRTLLFCSFWQEQDSCSFQIYFIVTSHHRKFVSTTTLLTRKKQLGLWVQTISFDKQDLGEKQWMVPLFFFPTYKKDRPFKCSEPRKKNHRSGRRMASAGVVASTLWCLHI